MSSTTLSLITSTGFADYALLDAGSGRKLERFGKIVVDRPEPQALGSRACRRPSGRKPTPSSRRPARTTRKANGASTNRCRKPGPCSIDDVTMLCKLSGLWHLGLFPEQHPHWQWMLSEIAKVKGETPRVLNLFGYTGAASLLAAKAGAEVTHVDASKKAIAWGQRKSIGVKVGRSQSPLDRR